MDYQNKYLKYKNKYLELKKQYGAGSDSHIGLDIRILPYIGTYNETKEEREYREARNIPPPNGYKIYDSIDEIIQYNYTRDDLNNTLSNYLLTNCTNSINIKINNVINRYSTTYNVTNNQNIDIDVINNIIVNKFTNIELETTYQYILQTNLTGLFGRIFNNQQLNILYIDARGDGNCFLNSLYIFSIMTNKQELIKTLCTNAYRSCDDVNFNDFKESMLFLSSNLIQTNRDIGHDQINRIIKELNDPNIPSVEPFGITYANHFNTEISVLQIDQHYKFINMTANFKPNNYNRYTDHIILIQKGDIHFGLIIPREDNKKIRNNLANYLYNLHNLHR